MCAVSCTPKKVRISAKNKHCTLQNKELHLSATRPPINKHELTKLYYSVRVIIDLPLETRHNIDIEKNNKIIITTNKTGVAMKKNVTTLAALILFAISSLYQTVSAQSYSLGFDGVNDYVGISPMPAYNSTMTIEAWIKIAIPNVYGIAEPNIISWVLLRNQSNSD